MNKRKRSIENTGARFSTSPKLFGRFSGVAISLLSLPHIHYASCYVEKVLRDQPIKTNEWQLRKWPFGPEKFSGLSRKVVQVPSNNGQSDWFAT